MRVYRDHIEIILKVKKLEKLIIVVVDCSIRYCTKRVSKLLYVVNDNERIIF